MVVAMAAGCISPDQQGARRLINHDRGAARLVHLPASDRAMRKAQRWSNHMASTWVLEHSGGGDRMDPSGLGAWCSVGENVGVGGSVSQVEAAFMRSPSHRANILGRYTVVGTGVTRRDGYAWVTQIFIRPC